MVSITLDSYEPTSEILNRYWELPHVALVVASVLGQAMLQRAIDALPSRLPPMNGGRTDNHISATAGKRVE